MYVYGICKEQVKQMNRQTINLSKNMRKTIFISMLCLLSYVAHGQTFDSRAFYKFYNDRGEVMDNGGSTDNMANIILGREAKGSAGQLLRIYAAEEGCYHLGLPGYDKGLDYTSDAKATSSSYSGTATQATSTSYGRLPPPARAATSSRRASMPSWP